ncbi:hypothetical protein HU200_007014 [Digitaria exilis]|uniref:Uncharacterized protein n=1 Tax=Digitaria exilis TaxID=1010633 RepID=A0A835FQD5_9POAL|nr:hypothetical protein HU200_007014 [Digitaria exilis]
MSGVAPRQLLLEGLEGSKMVNWPPSHRALRAPR